MSAPSTVRKYYVVWEGRAPGVYDSWEECEEQTKGFPGARYRSYKSQDDAVHAFRNGPGSDLDILRAIASHRSQHVNYEAFPEIRLDALAVDGACSRNPGPMEYRGVWVATGEELFRVGPLDDGTNNIGEYLAIARRDRNSDSWYIGAITGTNVCNMDVPLDFLDEGATYTARIFCDGENADYRTNPYDMDIHEMDVDSRTVLPLNLAPGGGAAVIIAKKR